MEEVSSADLRGQSPAVAFTETGVPVVSSFEYAPYAGTMNGCGNANTLRAGAYYLEGAAWRFVGYCSNYATVATGLRKATAAVVPTAGAVAVHAFVVANSGLLSTGVLDVSLAFPASELGEPWGIASDASRSAMAPPAMAAVRAAAMPTQVHYVYVAATGIGYSRQDGTDVAPTAAPIETASVSPTGLSPTVSRAPSPAQCDAVFWAEGNQVRRRLFRGQASTMTAASTIHTAKGAIDSLTSEAEPGGTAALTWRAGGRVYFGFGAPATEAATATPTASTSPADGASTVGVRAGPFLDSCGTAAAGLMVTLATTLGTIVEADAEVSQPGLQRPTDGSGGVSFTLKAPSSPGTAVVTASLAGGGVVARTEVTFEGVAGPDAGQQPDAGLPGADASAPGADAASQPPDAALPGADASSAAGADASAPLRFDSAPGLVDLRCGVAWSYSPQVSGAGPLTFSLEGDAPAGMTLDPATGTLRWTPAGEPTHRFTLVVRGGGGEARQEIALAVSCPSISYDIGCGCAQAEGLPALAALVLCLGAWRRRRG